MAEDKNNDKSDVNNYILNPDDDKNREYYSSIDNIKNSESTQEQVFKEDVKGNYQNLEVTNTNTLTGSTDMDLNISYVDINENNEKALKHNEVIGVYKPLDTKSRGELLKSNLRRQLVDSITSNVANLPSLAMYDGVDAVAKDQTKQLARFKLFDWLEDEFPTPSYRVDAHITIMYHKAVSGTDIYMEANKLGDAYRDKFHGLTYFVFKDVNFQGFNVDLKGSEYKMGSIVEREYPRAKKELPPISIKPTKLRFGFRSWESLVNQSKIKEIAGVVPGMGDTWDMFKNFVEQMTWIITQNRLKSSDSDDNKYSAIIRFELIPDKVGAEAVDFAYDVEKDNELTSLNFVFDYCYPTKVDMASLSNSHLANYKNATGSIGFEFDGAQLIQIYRTPQGIAKTSKK